MEVSVWRDWIFGVGSFGDSIFIYKDIIKDRTDTSFAIFCDIQPLYDRCIFFYVYSFLYGSLYMDSSSLQKI